MKKTFIAIATLTLGFAMSALITLPTTALDGTAREANTDNGVMPISETDDTTATNETTESTDTSDDINPESLDETDNTDLEDLEEAGTSGESEVVCTEESDEDCAAEVETTEEEPAEDCELDENGECIEEGEPATWPMILSFAAIGVTTIITIILAIAGRGKK